METLEELRDYVQDVVANIGQDFTEADDDWMQVACMQTEEGIIVAPLHNAFFKDGTSKDVLAVILAEAMRHFGAHRYAVLFNVHGKPFPTEEEVSYVRNEEMRVQHMPGAREMLILVYGDAEEERCASALIERDGVNPPTLCEWKEVPNFGGRFAGLNKAMRRVEERA